MNENTFSELSKEDLLDAGTYFPSLVNHSDMKPQLTTEDLDSINSKQSKFNALPNSEKVTELIVKYFDLDKYGDLSLLTDFEWAAQLIARKKILALLDLRNDSNRRARLQTTIFEICQNPITNRNKFRPNLSNINIKDLTVLDLHSISQTYRNNGDFDFIDSGLNFIGPDIYGIISTEEINSINSIDSPIKTPNISDNKYKVVATVDLSISDSQLKNEFAEFLENKRNELDLKPIVEEIKNKDKVSLMKHSVLQYLDLLVLTNYVDPAKKLINSKYATFLFPSTHPDYDKAYGKFNDSTLKYADKVLNGDTIQKLLSSINNQQAPSFGLI
jgi:hypothetical protein